MRLSMRLGYGDDFPAIAQRVVKLEEAGIDVVWVAEAYGYDAVSRLGYLAALTHRVQLAAGILPIYSRTPALIGQTAAGLDELSNGRFILGLGASGPQVIEGWHGVAYDRPVVRTRELIEICRMVWRRQELVYNGRA
jgi:alkanesulfonate monooxygenase SsuD/methylene tetrahydromethanopterin reductase-like flavin-dependent oxidoreductase (luciferase family)